MIEAIARSGSPSQLMRELMMCSFQKSQLKTLKVGSNIHFHASVESTVGMMNGSRMKARTQRLAAEVAVEQQREPQPERQLEHRGDARVARRCCSAAVRKIESSQSFSKFAQADEMARLADRRVR